jgi:hypothetical protein
MREIVFSEKFYNHPSKTSRKEADKKKSSQEKKINKRQKQKKEARKGTERGVWNRRSGNKHEIRGATNKKTKQNNKEKK